MGRIGVELGVERSVPEGIFVAVPRKTVHILKNGNTISVNSLRIVATDHAGVELARGLHTVGA